MTFPILPSNAAVTGFPLRSLRFNSADSAYLNRTPASATNQKTWTWSGWVKLSEITSSSRSLFGANLGGIYVTQGRLLTYFFTSPATNVQTSSVFRDPSSWYHFVIAIDTTQSTAANRIKIYVNSQIQPLINAIYPAQNADLGVNSTNAHTISTTYTPELFNGYLTEVNFIDGQALTPSSFGETNATTGQWQPKRYTGTYGTNGFYLNFSDNSGTTATTLGRDFSGNGNNWTPNNFSVTPGAGNDSMIDVPTNWADGGNGRGNYCTLNPLDNGGNTLSNGNLQVACGANLATRSSIGMTVGKFYMEFTVDVFGQSVAVGIATQQASLSGFLGQDAFGWSYIHTGQKYTNNTGASYGVSYTTNDIIGVAFDADSGALVFYKNGVSQGTAFTGLNNGPYFFALGSHTPTLTANFGQRPFAYTPPSGFKALNTQNLPSPTIAKGNTQFNPVLYTGNGSTQSVTGLAFTPDLVWIKSRSAATDHALYDVIRGAQSRLESNTTDAQVTSDGGLTAFGAAGFTLGTLAQVNTNTATYVAWAWKANGTGVTNTAGSITSTVSANPTAGFSVVTYTGNGTAGATIGHGLGVEPFFIVCKPRTTSSAWLVYHKSIGNTAYLLLNATDAAFSPSVEAWNNTTPSANVFTAGTGASVNGNAATYVAYCFAAIPGYSAFGSYTGNGSADGPFVYCGFRPRFVMVKRTDAADSWGIFDSSRDAYNAENALLRAESSNAEASMTSLVGNPFGDFLSNGFKVRNTSTLDNASGGTYIYAAFAESPFKYANAR